MTEKEIKYDIICKSIDLLESKYQEQSKLRDESRLRGDESHNCWCLDYRLGTTDGLLIALTELRKFNDKGQT